MEKKFSSLVVSDIHLKDATDTNIPVLFALLDQYAPQSKNLILLGDIFDFCFGRPAYFKKKYGFFKDKLIEIGQSTNTNIYFIEGNHEFHIKDTGWPCRFVSGDELELDGVIYAHGDHFAPEWGYHIFKSIVKSRLFYMVSYGIPPILLDAYASSHAKISRSLDKDFDHQPIIDAAFGWLGDRQTGIFGHYHVPYYIQNGPQTIAALDYWDKPNCILVDLAKNILRGAYTQERGWEILPPQIFVGK